MVITILTTVMLMVAYFLILYSGVALIQDSDEEDKKNTPCRGSEKQGVILRRKFIPMKV